MAIKRPPSVNSNEPASPFPWAQAVSPKGEYLPARAVLTRYDISAMTLHRWIRNPLLGFPRPMIINGRRYWSIEALLAWERERC